MFGWMRASPAGVAEKVPESPYGSNNTDLKGKRPLSSNGNVVLVDGSSVEVTDIEVQRTAFVPVDFAKNKVDEVVSDLEKMKLRYEAHVTGLKDFYEDAVQKTKTHYEKYILDLKAKALQHVNLERLIRNDIEVDLGNKIAAAEKTIEQLRDSLAELNRETQEKIRGLRRELDVANKRGDDLTSNLYEVTSRHTFQASLSQALMTANARKVDEIFRAKEIAWQLALRNVQLEMSEAREDSQKLSSKLETSEAVLASVQLQLTSAQEEQQLLIKEHDKFQEQVEVRTLISDCIETASAKVLQLQLAESKRRFQTLSSDLQLRLDSAQTESNVAASEFQVQLKEARDLVKQSTSQNTGILTEANRLICEQTLSTMIVGLEKENLEILLRDNAQLRQEVVSLQDNLLAQEKEVGFLSKKCSEQEKSFVSERQELLVAKESLALTVDNLTAGSTELKAANDALLQEVALLRQELDLRLIHSQAGVVVDRVIASAEAHSVQKAEAVADAASRQHFEDKIADLRAEIASLKAASKAHLEDAGRAQDVSAQVSVSSEQKLVVEELQSVVASPSAPQAATATSSSKDEILKLEGELQSLRRDNEDLRRQIATAVATVSEPVVELVVDTRQDEYNAEIASLSEEIIRYDEELRGLRLKGAELKELMTQLATEKKVKKHEIKQWVQQFREIHNRAPDKDDKDEIQETFQQYQEANDRLAECTQQAQEVAQTDADLEAKLGSARVTLNRLKKMRGQEWEDSSQQKGKKVSGKAEANSEIIDELEDQVFTLQEELAIEKANVTQCKDDMAYLQEKLDRMVKEKRSDVVKQFEEEILHLNMKGQQLQDTVTELTALKTKQDTKIKELKERTELAEAELKRRDDREMTALAPGDEKKELKTQVNKQREDIVMKTKAVAAGWDAAAAADERLNKEVDAAYAKGLKEGRQKNNAAWDALNSAVEVKENHITDLLVKLSEMEDKVRVSNLATTVMQQQLEVAKLEVADTIAMFADGSSGSGGASSAELDAARESLDQAQEEVVTANEKCESLENEMRVLEQKISVYEQLLSQRRVAEPSPGSHIAAMPSSGNGRIMDSADVDACATVLFAVKQACAKVLMILRLPLVCH
jgi:hypothetical protein